MRLGAEFGSRRILLISVSLVESFYSHPSLTCIRQFRSNLPQLPQFNSSICNQFVLLSVVLVPLCSSLGSEYDAVCVFLPWFDSQLIRLVDTDAGCLCREITEVTLASPLCKFSLLDTELNEDEPAVGKSELVCSPFIFVLVEVVVIARDSGWRLSLMS